jgi:amino acid transporter
MSSHTLARRTLGPGALLILAIVASSPLTVAVAGIPTTFAATGATGVPLSFVVIAAVLGLLAMAFLGVCGHVPHASPFFAVWARGLGRRSGLAAALLGFVAYNAIQISLYPFLGTRLVALVGGVWWQWAAVAWLIVTALGVLRMTTNTMLLGGLLLVELTVLLLFVVAAMTVPAQSAGWEDLSWNSLAAQGLGGVLALGVAAFVGFEGGPTYAEESRGPAVVRGATLGVAGLLGVFYALMAWAVLTGVGMPRLTGGGDPSEVVFDLLRRVYGAGVVDVATLLLVTSVLAAMASFHHLVARHLFGLAREQVLPARLAAVSTGVRGGTPLAGSLLQSAVAALVIAGFVWSGLDPMAVMFTWLSTLGAVGVMCLLAGSAVAAYFFYRNGGGRNENALTRIVVPLGGAILGGLLMVFMFDNLNGLLALPPGSALVWLLPGIVVVTLLAGWVWGQVLRATRPKVFAGLGLGTPAPVTVLDHDLAGLEV